MRFAYAIALGLAAALTSQVAEAQVTYKCEGEAWTALAKHRYGEERYAPLLAAFNRQEGSEACPSGKFIRWIAVLDHEVRSGQTVKSITSRFLRGRGAARIVRRYNELPEGKEPKEGDFLKLPAEVKVTIEDPAAFAAMIEGVVELALVLEHNGLKPGTELKAKQSLYVPLFPATADGDTPPPAPTAAPEPETPAPSVDAGTTDAGESASGTPSDAKPAPPAGVTLSPLPSAEPVKLKEVRNVPEIPARFDTFPHPEHAEAMLGDYQCQYCHIDDPRIPHTYLPVPTAICGQCHSKVDGERERLRIMQLPLSFSHDQHLSPEREVAKDYKGVDCARCHAVSEDGVSRRPGHPECAKCHNAAENKVAVEKDCAACHGKAEEADRLAAATALLATHLRSAVRGNNLIFEHGNHIAHLQAEGAASATETCDRCHAGARKADTLAEIGGQRMADCLDCHTGLKKVVNDTVQSLDECRTCHIEASTALKPTFEAVVEKPLSHSAYFRRNHGREAAADRGVCQSCHSVMAGGDGKDCDRCHEQMKPRDHSVRWREEPHGRASIREPGRCATCHLQDRCADCHSIAPRGHFPRAAFVAGGHGRQARQSLRRCQTCHLPSVDCARCHDVANR